MISNNFILLPKVNNVNIELNISFTNANANANANELQLPIISFSLHNYLNELKTQYSSFCVKDNIMFYFIHPFENFIIMIPPTNMEGSTDTFYDLCEIFNTIPFLYPFIQKYNITLHKGVSAINSIQFINHINYINQSGQETTKLLDKECNYDKPLTTN